MGSELAAWLAIGWPLGSFGGRVKRAGRVVGRHHGSRRVLASARYALAFGGSMRVKSAASYEAKRRAASNR